MQTQHSEIIKWVFVGFATQLTVTVVADSQRSVWVVVEAARVSGGIVVSASADEHLGEVDELIGPNGRLPRFLVAVSRIESDVRCAVLASEEAYLVASR